MLEENFLKNSLKSLANNWEVICLRFITLLKWKKAPTKELVYEATDPLTELENQGIKLDVYWTLGRYDAVTIIDASNEKDAMKALLRFQEIVDTETLVAIPREQAIKLL